TGSLTPVPPVLAVLSDGPMSRQSLISECERRFQQKPRTTDQALAHLRQFIQETRQGNAKMFALNLDAILALSADDDSRARYPWMRFVDSVGRKSAKTSATGVVLQKFSHKSFPLASTGLQ